MVCPRFLSSTRASTFSVSDVHRGLVKGLGLCEDITVAELNLSDRLEFYGRAHVRLDDGEFVRTFSQEAAIDMAALGVEAALYEFWPDVVVIVSGFFIPPKMWGVLARRPHHVVYWCTESPYEDDRQARGARYADTVILNDPTNLDKFRTEVNERTFYLPHSYDPDVHYPGNGDTECDFAFVGTGFPSRVEWLEKVDWSGIDARIAGNWKIVEDDSPILPLLTDERGYCLANADTAALYRSAKVSLNLYRKEHSDDAHADGWAMGPREVELAACGTFFFREERGEGDELFPMLPVVSDPAEFSEQLRYWLANDDARRAAAEGARKAIADRTFQNTARRLLDIVEAAALKIPA
jgi:spore maturation protein CgeB